jgi:hypothetical protein
MEDTPNSAENTHPASMQNAWATGALKPKSIENKDEAFLTQLAKDIAMNLVFTLDQIADPSIANMVFMPLMFGAFSDCTKEYIEDIGMVYEYYNKAGPTAINGYPIFFSCAFINRHDAKIVWEKYQKIQAALDAV